MYIYIIIKEKTFLKIKLVTFFRLFTNLWVLMGRNITSRKIFVLFNSVQEFIEIQASLVLSFFICLRNQRIH